MKGMINFNKRFNYHNKSVAPPTLNIKSILERYFLTGNVPEVCVNLNSRTEQGEENASAQKTVKREEEEFEKIVKGTYVKVKVRIQVVKNIKRDCTLEWLEIFENLSSANEWTDNQMGIICYSLIHDPVKENFKEDSYKEIRDNIIKIIYPISDKRVINSKIKSIKQENYVHIQDYYNALKTLVEEYAVLNGSSKNSTEERLEESFIENLGEYTILELKKARIYNSSIRTIMEFLEDIEKE